MSSAPTLCATCRQSNPRSNPRTPRRSPADLRAAPNFSRWAGADFDADAGTIVVSVKAIREKAGDLVRVDETETDAGRRVILLPVRCCCKRRVNAD
jgi:hypothetical protein